MKKLITIFLLLVLIFLTSFTNKTEPKIASTYYAFVTTTEWDKRYDEPGNNGYVDITTDIISFNCSRSESNIKYQFIDHYNAQEANDNRKLAFNNSTTSVWIYTSYDDAVVSKREWMAKQNSKHKRTILNFYVSCK